jgi:hypothetical protein
MAFPSTPALDEVACGFSYVNATAFGVRRLFAEYDQSPCKRTGMESYYSESDLCASFIRK